MVFVKDLCWIAKQFSSFDAVTKGFVLNHPFPLLLRPAGLFRQTWIRRVQRIMEGLESLEGLFCKKYSVQVFISIFCMLFHFLTFNILTKPSAELTQGGNRILQRFDPILFKTYEKEIRNLCGTQTWKCASCIQRRYRSHTVHHMIM